MSQTKKIALLSVFGKDGLDGVIIRLKALGYDLVSTGGTATYIREHDFDVTEVSELTGWPEMFRDLLKTIHPVVHGGLLPPRTKTNDTELAKHKIGRIGFIYVSIYDLLSALKQGVTDVGELTGKCDMGGPAMIASAAKGALLEFTKTFKDEKDRPDYDDGTTYLGPVIVTSVEDAHKALDWIEAGQPEARQFVQTMAAKAFWICATHRAGAAVALGDGKYFSLMGEDGHELLKAENGQQGPARVYVTDHDHPFGPDTFVELQGHNIGYCVTTDRDRDIMTFAKAAMTLAANGLSIPCMGGASKHGNICSAAWGTNPQEVLEKLVICDKEAILGATIVTNFPLSATDGEIIRRFGLTEDEKSRLIDQLVAPAIDPELIPGFVRKDGKTVIFENPNLAFLGSPELSQKLVGPMIRPIMGGFIVQQNYLSHLIDLNDPNFYKQGELTDEELVDFVFCQAINSTGNSNQVTLVKDGRLIANGVGQQARMRVANLASDLALENSPKVIGCLACSDSFFPQEDGAEALIDAGCSFVFSTCTTNEKRDERIRQLFLKHGVRCWQLPDTTDRGFSWH